MERGAAECQTVMLSPECVGLTPAGADVHPPAFVGRFESILYLDPGSGFN